VGGITHGKTSKTGKEGGEMNKSFKSKRANYGGGKC